MSDRDGDAKRSSVTLAGLVERGEGPAGPRWIPAPPQLMEITLGLFVVSWTAVETASMKPWSVLGAK